MLLLDKPRGGVRANRARRPSGKRSILLGLPLVLQVTLPAITELRETGAKSQSGPADA